MTSRIMVQLVMVLLFSGLAHAGSPARIELGEAEGSRGSSINIPVILHKSEGVKIAAIGLDIIYDENVLENPTVEAGPSALSAEKSIIQNTVNDGIVRVGIISMQNNKIIEDGVVANLKFVVKGKAETGVTKLTNNPSASDPQGNDIGNLAGSDGVISIK